MLDSKADSALDDAAGEDDGALCSDGEAAVFPGGWIVLSVTLYIVTCMFWLRVSELASPFCQNWFMLLEFSLKARRME